MNQAATDWRTQATAPRRAWSWHAVVDGDDEPPFDEPVEYPRDPNTDAAKNAILALLEKEPDLVLYHRQLVVWLERRFFHWVTGRAVRELVEEGELRSGRGPAANL